MKFLLLSLLALPSLGVTPLLDHTWREAKNPNTPISLIEMGCLKAATEKENTPSEVFLCVASQRGAWTPQEIYRIFNAVLFGAKLNGSFVSDYCNFVSNVQSDSEGLKLIEELHNFSQANNEGAFEYVIGQILNDAIGEPNIANFHAYSHSTLSISVTPNSISPQN